MRELLHLLAIAALIMGLTLVSLVDADTPAAPEKPADIFLKHTVFPKDNAWNTDISQTPVDPKSADYIAAVGKDKPLHPDFGPGTDGIPYQFADRATPRYPVKFDYPDESDKGPYPIPDHPLIEGGPGATDGDRHLLVIDRDNWMLYEIWEAVRQPDGSWHGGSGAIFDLKTNATRPAGWTSSDAAGLAVFPGLVRYDEVHEKKVINHAVRFTVQRSRHAYVAPASHYASNRNDPNLLPMGARLRLRKDFDISGFDPHVQVILTALKTYGMILADNGSDWFISGAPDDHWDNDVLHQLSRVKGKDFEVLEMKDIVTR